MQPWSTRFSGAKGCVANKKPRKGIATYTGGSDSTSAGYFVANKKPRKGIATSMSLEVSWRESSLSQTKSPVRGLQPYTRQWHQRITSLRSQTKSPVRGLQPPCHGRPDEVQETHLVANKKPRKGIATSSSGGSGSNSAARVANKKPRKGIATSLLPSVEHWAPEVGRKQKAP